MVVGDRQVRLPIAVEVAGGESDRAAAHRVLRGRRKDPLSMVDQYRHLVGTGIGDHQVGPAVGIHVGAQYLGQTVSYRVKDRRLKSSIAAAIQKGNAALTGDRQVGVPVAIKVPGGQIARLGYVRADGREERDRADRVSGAGREHPDQKSG